MSIADEILALVERKRRLSLTLEDIAEMLYGQKDGYPQRVEKPCQKLVKEKKLVKCGNGGEADPYTYHLPPIMRRA
jgi:hypothetical protein